MAGHFQLAGDHTPIIWKKSILSCGSHVTKYRVSTLEGHLHECVQRRALNCAGHCASPKQLEQVAPEQQVLVANPAHTSDSQAERRVEPPPVILIPNEAHTRCQVLPPFLDEHRTARWKISTLEEHPKNIMHPTKFTKHSRRSHLHTPGTNEPAGHTWRENLHSGGKVYLTHLVLKIIYRRLIASPQNTRARCRWLLRVISAQQTKWALWTPNYEMLHLQNLK